MAAHLAGAVAAQTTLPVIGVPLSGGALNGVDALYATVQMPRGIPVATVAVDGRAQRRVARGGDPRRLGPVPGRRSSPATVTGGHEAGLFRSWPTTWSSSPGSARTCTGTPLVRITPCEALRERRQQQRPPRRTPAARSAGDAERWALRPEGVDEAAAQKERPHARHRRGPPRRGAAHTQASQSLLRWAPAALGGNCRNPRSPGGDRSVRPAGDGRAVHRRSPLRRHARGRVARHRGVGGARCRPLEDAVAARAHAPEITPAVVAAIAERERVTDHDTAAFVDVISSSIGSPAGQLDPLRADFFGCRRHRPVPSADAGPRTCLLAALGGLDRQPEGAGASSSGPRRRSAGPTASTPSRRRSAPSSRSGASRPTATVAASVPAADRGRGREAVGRGRHLLQRRPVDRGVGLRRPRPHAGALHAGHRPRPARRAALRLRRHRDHDRAHRHRDPPSPAHRGGRGVGAVRRRAEGLLGHAPQAQPGQERAADAARRGCCGATSGRPSRTWPSGTSATSPTPPSSGSSSRTRASSPTTCWSPAAG